MKTLKKLSIAIALGLISFNNLNAQTKESIAILDVHSINTLYKGDEMTRLLRSEATKLNQEVILDVYEMKEIFSENKFNDSTCFSKRCGIAAGNLLDVNKVITGSVERFGEKIIITLNLIDIKTEKVLKQDVTEYINKESEIQRMLRVSISKLMTNKADEQLARELEYIETPVSNDNDIINLNGPRMGVTIITGDAAERLTDNYENGGFEMLGSKDAAFTSTMGFQWEKRYLATNNFQALVEIIPLVSGMEVGKLNPSVTFLNGLRLSKSNWEFGFGPTFKFKTVRDGYFLENGTFVIDSDWNEETMGARPEVKQRNVLHSSRGEFVGDMGMIFAVGKTFQSGRLNVPVNLYYAPSKKSSVIGLSVGFNIQKVK